MTISTTRVTTDADGRSVRLPDDCRFRGDAVLVQRVGDAVVLWPPAPTGARLRALLDAIGPIVVERERLDAQQRAALDRVVRAPPDFVLGTDVCIALPNRRDGSERVLDRLDAVAPESVSLSAITAAELRFGVAASARPESNAARLDLFLSSFDLLPFDEVDAIAYGPVRAGLRNRGTPIGAMDMLIAAHAISRGATLVTGNVREFERVEGLRIIDWLPAG